MAEVGRDIPEPAIVCGEPPVHVAWVIFDTDADVHGLYANVRLASPAGVHNLADSYLSEKGEGGILKPRALLGGVSLIEGFVERDDVRDTAGRREAILNAVGHLVGDLDALALASGQWAQFEEPGHTIQVVRPNIADEA